MTTYRSYPVFPDSNLPDNEIQYSVISDLNAIGKSFNKELTHFNELGRFKMQMKFFCKSHQERAALRDFFYSVQGKYKPFWIRTFKHQFDLLETTSAGERTIRVRPTNDALVNSYIKETHIYVPKQDAAYEILAVSSGFDDNNNPYTELTLKDPLGGTLEPCDTMERFLFGRFDTDTITFNFDDIRYSTTDLTFIEFVLEQYQRDVPDT